MRYIIKSGLLTLTVVIFFLSKDIGIFWDNVLFVSKMGGYLYDHDIFNWLLPDIIDPGHPPFIGFIQALGWNIFGKHLWVSHIIMTPFIYGLLYQIYILVSHYIKNYKYQLLAFILILADPTLQAQFFYVSPEVIQLFFFFLSVNSILKDNIRLKTLGLFFLGLVSLRGMMLCAGVFIFELSMYVLIKKRNLFDFLLNPKIIISYIIGAIPAVSFIGWHYFTKGWVFTHENSPWAGTNDFANIKEFIFNLIVISHRYMDFGRIGIVVFILMVFIFKRRLFNDINIKKLLLLALTSVFVIIIVSLEIVNPMGHRYFIASYISINLLSFLLLMQLNKLRKGIYIILVTILMTGNLWIYPERISQGWDASLAGLPYFNLRRQAIEYLTEKKYDLKTTCSFFPNVAKVSDVDINNDNRSIKEFNQDYDIVIYSNVYNLSDEEYEILEKDYTIIKSFQTNRIYVNIMEKKQGAVWERRE